ncbi:MAG: hypothetical protein FWB72_06405 [Firmicutes bacterium]|nr:hypothetical protein [Bacillota bacterium]
MKKQNRKVLSLLIALSLVFSLFAFSACENLEIRTSPFSTFDFVAGTYITEVPFGEQPDFNGTEVRIAFADTERAPVVATYAGGVWANKPEGATIALSLNTNVAGAQTLTANIEYRGFNASATRQVIVISYGATDITALMLPAFLITYTGNIATDAQNERNNFKKADAGYYVGTANNFDFFPQIWAIDQGSPRTVPVGGFTPDVSVYKRVGDAAWDTITTPLPAENPYVTVNARLGQFRFTEAAIGDDISFRIVQSIPYEYIYEDNRAVVLPIALENVRVVDAWNATTVACLRLLDNRYATHTAGYAVPFNRGNTPTRDVWLTVSPEREINGLVLHNTMTITAAHLPQRTEQGLLVPGATGPLIRNGFVLFERLLKSDATTDFNFIGNFFNISTAQLPRVSGVTGALGGQLSQASLFAFDNFSENYAINVRNFSATSNVVRSPFASDAAGITFAYIGGKVNVTNAIITGHHIVFNVYERMQYYHDVQRAHLTARYLRAYDAWFGFAYVHDARIDIYNSDIQDFGGPAIVIADSPGRTHHDILLRSYNAPEVSVTDSTVASFVTGAAPWFALHGVTPLFTQVTDLETLLFRNPDALGGFNRSIFTPIPVDFGPPIWAHNILVVFQQDPEDPVWALAPDHVATGFFRERTTTNGVAGEWSYVLNLGSHAASEGVRAGMQNVVSTQLGGTNLQVGDTVLRFSTDLVGIVNPLQRATLFPQLDIPQNQLTVATTNRKGLYIQQPGGFWMAIGMELFNWTPPQA